jgi:late competence protein required for DNA uptake (superfamily II DNA/RNA helicase)
MSQEPLSRFDNDRHLMCSRCHKHQAEFVGVLADGFPRAMLCRDCVVEIIDYMEGYLSL